LARFALVALVAAWCLASAVPGGARGPYRIGYSPDAQIHVAARDRLKAVYERAGLPVEFVPLPQKRSLVQAVDGIIDGDVGRIPGLEKRFPSLVRVDVKLMDLVGVAYVIKGQGIGDYRSELLATRRPGAVRGVLWAEKVMGGLRLEEVNNYATLFEMLTEGRIDLALASKISAETLFQADKERYADIRGLNPPVYHVPFYHYVNIGNADIVPKLEKALRGLRAEGLWRDEASN
jgi:polar amino acid transport system substrate-binding protein